MIEHKIQSFLWGAKSHTWDQTPAGGNPPRIPLPFKALKIPKLLPPGICAPQEHYWQAFAPRRSITGRHSRPTGASLAGIRAPQAHTCRCPLPTDASLAGVSASQV
jgi:hypothetical protein